MVTLALEEVQETREPLETLGTRATMALAEVVGRLALLVIPEQPVMLVIPADRKSVV